MQNSVKEKNKKREEEIKKLVIARLGVLPADKRISVGAEGEFSRDDLIEGVRKNDEIGQKITKLQLEYLTSLKKGIFYEQELISNKAER